MATWVFDEITLSSGIYRVSFTNDNGDLGTYYPSGDYIFTLAKTNEVAENNGIGGVAQIANMDVEVYDKDNLFIDNIFSRGSITNVQMKILIHTNDTYYYVFYGDVDLSTIEYPSYYDDEAGKEYHSCSFVVFSLLNRLKTVDVGTLNTSVNIIKIAGIYHPSNNAAVTVVNLMDVIYEISKLITLNTGYPLSFFSTTWRIEPNSGGQNKSFDELFIFYDPPSADYKTLFGDPSIATGSLLTMGDCLAVLKTITGNFLAYCVFIYDNLLDQIQLHIKQRGSGTVYTSSDLGILKTSTFRAFAGYDAIKIYPIDTFRLFSSNNDAQLKTWYYPLTLSESQFQVVSQKFTHSVHFHTNNNDGTLYSLYGRSTVDGKYEDVTRINELQDNGSWHRFMEQWLFQKMVKYWCNHTNGTLGTPALISPTMYERTYRGVSLGAVSIQLFDVLTIGVVNYTIIEITRDLVENEMTLKLVEY